MKRRMRLAEPRALGVPAEILDPHALVWHDAGAFCTYMQLRGWQLPAQERMGVESSTENRRMHAAGEWAIEAGLTHEGDADWRRLRALGAVP